MLRRLLLCLAILLVPRAAHAFCGFYVSGADTKMFNDATQVVLMREGTKTAIAMQNDYKGPPQDFAMVVPVPVVLQKENVKTLAKDVFERIEQLSSPRLVEYWEQNPCPEGIGLGNIGTLGHGAGTGQGFGSGHGRLGGASSVTVEAQFEVGEYEIVILSAKDSSGLDAWLREHGYKIPDGSDKALAPYVAAGSKFFVAKVNVAKVKFVDGRASLSPLRFHYDSEKFELPVKLGMLNSGGTQDLIVYVVANDRYEVANAPNVFIPTNLDVSEKARGSFGAFYAALFDDTLAKHPGAVVTEYAWPSTMGACDPCPDRVTGLSGADLASLGADVMPGIWWTGVRAGTGGAAVTIRQGTTTVNGPLPPEVVQRIARQNFGRFRLCYENGLRANPGLAGTVKVKFEIDPTGAVTSAVDDGSDLPDKNVVACITRGFSNLSFPAPENGKKVVVTYPLILGSGTSVAAPSQPATLPKGPVTVTRLHTRYGKDALGSDLVFRVADPVVGGRESMGSDGKLEVGPRRVSGSSNFQARYAIRHPWTGPVTCKEPQRGVWGPPPAGAASPGTKAATKLAYAPRGAGYALASFAIGAIPDVQLAPGAAVTAVTDAGAPDAASADVDAGAPAVADAGVDAGNMQAPPQVPPARCGCRAVGSAAPAGGGLFVLALGLLAIRARRR